MDRREFLRRAGWGMGSVVALPLFPAHMHAVTPRAGEFVFARLRYDSGDWDYNPKVCANVLDAVLQYTTIPVKQDEVVITLD